MYFMFDSKIKKTMYWFAIFICTLMLLVSIGLIFWEKASRSSRFRYPVGSQVSLTEEVAEKYAKIAIRQYDSSAALFVAIPYDHNKPNVFALNESGGSGYILFGSSPTGIPRYAVSLSIQGGPREIICEIYAVK